MTLSDLRARLSDLHSSSAGVREQIEQTYLRLTEAAPESPEASQLKQRLVDLRKEFSSVRVRERSLVGDADMRQFVSQLDGAIPIVLVPLRVQTRFRHDQDGGTTLLIRVYPDDVAVQRHEPRLSESERRAGKLFWNAAAVSADPDEPTRRTVWRGIVARFNLRRAAWIIKATNPNALQGGDTLDEPVRVPAAWTLPERLVFRLFGQSDHLLANELQGALIPDGLEMGLDPTQPDLGFNLSGGDLDYPPEVRWQTDFDAAIAVGMGVAVKLKDLGNPRRIERLIVVGVRIGTDERRSADLLMQLIDDHRYTDGFSIVPQGTPTNVTNDDDAPTPADVDATFTWLTGPGAYKGDGRDILYEDECDGLRLAHALGISPDATRYVERADCGDGREAIAMKRALWAGTLGYYIQQMLAPMLESPAPPFDPHLPERLILAARFFFTHFVFGRGPLPAIRVGAQPYGMLPISADTIAGGADAISPWADSFLDPFLRQLHDKMLLLAPTWIALSGQTPRAGAGPNANARLLDVLARQASSVEWHAERFAGPEYLKAYADFKNQGIGTNTPFNQFLAQLTQRFDAFQSTFPGLFSRWPRIFDLTFFGAYWATIVSHLGQQIKGLDRGLSALLTGDVVDNHPYSERRGIDPAYPNYIAWLGSNTFEDVRRGLLHTNAKGAVEPVTALLYMALRQSLLYEHAFLAMRLFSRFRTNPANGRPYAWSDFAEKELYNTGFSFETTYWDFVHMANDAGWPLGTPIPTKGSVLDLVRSRDGLRQAVPDWKSTFGDIDESYRALGMFARDGFPTARLERLFAEHMDLASYRLDAWLTGHAFQRLLAHRVWRRESRAGRTSPLRPAPGETSLVRYDLNHRPLGPYSTGIYLGAYGWIEGIEAGPVGRPVDDLPRELTPLNRGSVTRDPDNYGLVHAPSLNQATTAAVLRSASVTEPNTTAFNVDLSSTRTRDALWIIDGVRNGQSPAALLGYRFERALRDRDPQLQQHLPALRAGFPMPRQVDTDPGPQAAIPAHDVVNGLLMVQARRDSTLGTKLAAIPAPDSSVIANLVDGIADALDACGDLMLAESVHQAAQGNYDRAGAVVTAAGEFTHVPEDFDVLRTPRSGTALVHRLLVATNAPIGAAPATLRARLEPALNDWVGSLIGPLTAITCDVSYTFASGQFATTVSWDQFGLEPIDFAFLTDERFESELNARLDLAARPAFDAVHPGEAIVEIVVDTTNAIAVIALLQRLRELLTFSRPASLRDFVAPSTLHGLSGDALDAIDADELTERVLGVRQDNLALRDPDSLWLQFDALVTACHAPVADPESLLLLASQFGVTEAVPRGGDLDAQIVRVAEVLEARMEKAIRIWTPFTPPVKDALRICREIVEALLGGAFPLMPRLTLPGTVAGAALAPASPDQVDDWLFQNSALREGARRMQYVRVLGEELATALNPLQLFQWPTTNTQWIALAPLSRTQLAGDLVSIVVQPAGAFDVTDTVTALVIDEWMETIPPSEEVTGITFHYDAPNAEPPQALLLAVSQRRELTNLRWTWDEVTACVDQALLLAKMRTVGPDDLRRTRLDPVLPATLAPETMFPATISTSWFGNVVGEVATEMVTRLRET